MSLNIFENTNLEFDVSIVKTTRIADGKGVIKNVVESVTPLEAAAVLNLELRESSLSMGFTGSITVGNKFKILDKLNITTNSSNEVYVAIKITDTELQNIDIEDTNKCITVVGYINNTASASANAIDGAVVFSFEEAFVAALKQTQTVIFTGKTSTEGRTLIEQDDTDYTITSLLDAFNSKVYKLKDTDTIITEDSGEPNVFVDIKLAIDEVPSGSTSSVYDTVQQMLEISCVGEQKNSNLLGTAKTSYLRFVNSLSDDPTKSDTIIRKIKFDSFFTPRHSEFVKAVVNKQSSSRDFSDVYLEKFTLGPISDSLPTDPNTNLYNRIETYDITRANASQLRDKTWGDYRVDKTLPGQDISKFSSTTLNFFDILQSYIFANFTDLELDFNLPIIDPKGLKEFHIPFKCYSTDKDVNRSIVQQYNYITNKVHKSFFTIGETINFTVKGSVIRQPNKFIWVEDGAEDKDYKKLWYVNSVNHRFSSGRYTNDIIATKIFGDISYNTIMANELQNLAPGGEIDNSSSNIPPNLA